MLNIDWLEWLGYLASILVLISLLMSSIIKLRWINLVGSFIFALYGFLIGAVPVGVVNLCIGGINIYYLIKIYSAKSAKEYFKILPIDMKSPYLNYFLEFYKDEIKNYFPNTDLNFKDNEIGFYILRNLVPAGIFIASENSPQTLQVNLDFVIPEYRDFKIGTFIYEEQQDYFKKQGYTQFISQSFSEKHNHYLKKMGFMEKKVHGKTIFTKSII